VQLFDGGGGIRLDGLESGSGLGLVLGRDGEVAMSLWVHWVMVGWVVCCIDLVWRGSGLVGFGIGSRFFFGSLLHSCIAAIITIGLFFCPSHFSLHTRLIGPASGGHRTYFLFLLDTHIPTPTHTLTVPMAASLYFPALPELG